MLRSGLSLFCALATGWRWRWHAHGQDAVEARGRANTKNGEYRSSDYASAAGEALEQGARENQRLVDPEGLRAGHTRWPVRRLQSQSGTTPN